MVCTSEDEELNQGLPGVPQQLGPVPRKSRELFGKAIRKFTTC